MRIAVFHEVQKGGARRAINEFAVRLRKHHNVDLYTTEKLESDELDNYTHVYRYRFKSANWKGKNFRKKIKSDTLDLWSLNFIHKKIAKRLNKGDYNIVLTNPSRHLQTPFILRYLDPPSVFYLHDPHYRYIYESELLPDERLDPARRTYEGLVREMRKRLDRSNLLKAGSLIANSDYTARTAYKTYGIKSSVSYLGVDESFFKQSKKKRDIDILYIGSTHKVDNYDLALKAVSGLSKNFSVKYVLTDKQWYRSEELKELYQRAKVVLSLTSNDSFGLVVLEAIASGAIPIALNQGGYKESILQGETGFLVSKSPSVLAKKIDYLLSNSAVRKKMQRNGLTEIKKNWTWSVATKNLQANLLKILKKNEK